MMLAQSPASFGVPIAYCNAVGGNDQLVFDGNSLVIDARGNCSRSSPLFEEHVVVVDLDPARQTPGLEAGEDGGALTTRSSSACATTCTNAVSNPPCSA